MVLCELFLTLTQVFHSVLSLPLGLLLFHPPLLARIIYMKCLTLLETPLLSRDCLHQRPLVVPRQSGQLGLDGSQKRPGEHRRDDGPEPLMHTHSQDPEILSCHPSGDTTLKGKMLRMSPGRGRGNSLSPSRRRPTRILLGSDG